MNILDHQHEDVTKTKRLKPLTVLKSVGPKLVPFFKTVSIFFVLFGQEERCSIFFCIVKCLPVVSLIVFVLLHGMSLDECYRYSRRILIGLVFSVIGDAFLVWKLYYKNLELGLLSFAIAQCMYARAFGWRPLKPYAGSAFLVAGLCVYTYLQSYLRGVMVYLAPFYITLICTMSWRSVARVHFYDDLWTWTKLCGCAGALCFLISDLVIAVNMFAFPVPFAHQIVMLTYYAAQFGISLSVVDSQADELIRIQKKQ
ncbi:lysoplasmalogenase-like protein TMEM86A [Physella acuta]|uniref:lysoplasmalogenase-like protein TMEM86A n=1 Tax=Physella acuta TaxID=109671 RepID=UPI0027DC64C5|nr:lysoplasmalogenase-like protein TMEM86A [Physella acuta]